MENLPLISVIVPVYKVEAYLDKCVQSIVDQTFTNLEIILVDDGSPDNCPAMCDAWAEKDSRIRVIHQENQGGGAARNAALDIAQGEYISLIDSDDYIEPHMYEYLLSLMTDGVDIAECGLLETELDDAPLDDGSYFESDVYTVEQAMKLHIADTMFRQTPPNKLYRYSAISDVRFPVGNRIDDEFFTYRVIANARKLARISCNMYAYRQQPDSVMHVPSVQKCVEAVEAKAQRHAYIEAHFPALAELSLASLYGAALYQGQLALRQYDEPETILRQIEAILSAQNGRPKGNGFKEKLWLWCASRDLERTARLRNALRIGL